MWLPPRWPLHSELADWHSRRTAVSPAETRGGPRLIGLLRARPCRSPMHECCVVFNQPLPDQSATQPEQEKSGRRRAGGTGGGGSRRITRLPRSSDN